MNGAFASDILDIIINCHLYTVLSVAIASVYFLIWISVKHIFLL